MVRSWRSLTWSKGERDNYYTTPPIYNQSHEFNVQTPTQFMYNRVTVIVELSIVKNFQMKAV